MKNDTKIEHQAILFIEKINMMDNKSIYRMRNKIRNYDLSDKEINFLENLIARVLELKSK